MKEGYIMSYVYQLDFGRIHETYSEEVNGIYGCWFANKI